MTEIPEDDISHEEMIELIDAAWERAIPLAPLTILDTRYSVGGFASGDGDVLFILKCLNVDVNGVTVELPLAMSFDYAVALGLIDEDEADALEAEGRAQQAILISNQTTEEATK